MRFWFSAPRILGIRPGISFSPNDFIKRSSGRRSEPIEGSFVYVIKAPNDRVKIGVTKNPSARLKALQTGSHAPLRFAFIGCTPGEGYDIEQAAHNVLATYRLAGEWFDVPAEMAIAAVISCAWKLGHRIEIISQEQADKVLAIGAAEDRRSSGVSLLIRIPAIILLIVISLLITFVIVAFSL